MAHRKSCLYLESGMSFYADRITACGVVHHGTGCPTLALYEGGPFPAREIARKREEIMRENQADGHSACRDCPYLESRDWPDSEASIRWLGITHFNGCNLACSYCWLQWADNSPRLSPDHRTRPYEVKGLIEDFIASGVLATDAVVDWGGGGEPTLMPEFDDVFALLSSHGITQWLHTNAIRLPEPARASDFDFTKLNILCSVDAGSRQTYRQLKGRDGLEDVWENLAHFRSSGAKVVTKYIVTPENCSRKEIEEFVGRAARAGMEIIQPDIDLRYPAPDRSIIEGLAFLLFAAAQAKIPVQFGSTGVHSALEYRVEEQARRVFESLCMDDLAAFLDERNHYVPDWSHPALEVRRYVEYRERSLRQVAARAVDAPILRWLQGWLMRRLRALS
jgi:pyruvate-formate lyase-activating enzyme